MKKLLSDTMIELHVPDFNIVKKFYGDLGFELVWERKPRGRKGYLVMRKGDNILNFYCGNKHVYGHSYFKRFPRNTERGYGVEIIIPLDDIKDFYEKVFSKYKNLIVRPLKIRFNKWDFRMIDPFGYYLRFVNRYNWVHGRDKQGNEIIKK